MTDFHCPVYRNQSLLKGNATSAISLTGVVDWHLNGDRLVYRYKSDDIRIRVLRHCSGQAITSPKLTSYRLHKDIVGVPLMILFLQILKDGDLLITAWPKPGGPENYPSITYLLRSSLRTERMQLYDSPDEAERDPWFLIDEKRLVYRLDMVDQLICRPATGQHAIYYVQKKAWIFHGKSATLCQSQPYR